MLACSRFWIAAAISLPGWLCAAEHCRIVSSPTRREAQPAGAVGNAALMAASARAASTCCADAGAALSERASIVMARRMTVSSALQSGDGDLATRGLPGQKRDQCNTRVGPELNLRHAHLPIAVVQPVLH